jgi:hypothetical protein
MRGLGRWCARRVGGALLGVIALGAGCRPARPAATVPAAARATTAVAAAKARPAPAPLPQLSLRSAADARSALIWDAIAAAPAETARALDALAGKVGLRVPLGASFLDALGDAQIPHVAFSRATLARLDPARPLVAVGMLRPRTTCVAVPFRDASDVARALEEIGPENARHDAESYRFTADRRMLAAAVFDRTLFLSEHIQTVAACAAIAIELADAAAALPRRRALTFEVYPNVLGAFGRATAYAALPKALEEIEAGGDAGNGTSTGKMTHEMVALIGGLARLGIGGSAAVHVLRASVDVGADAGFSLRLEADPTPGSDFARRLAVTTPYAVDEALGPPDDRTSFFAWGSLGTGVADFAQVLSQGGPTAQALRQSVIELGAMIEGGGACKLDFAAAPARTLCAWRLRAGASPRKLLARYGLFIERLTGWVAALAGRPAGHVKVRQGRDVLETDAPMAVTSDEPPAARAFRRAIWGSDTISSAVAVRGRWLVIAQGGRPREVLATFGKPAAARAPGTRLGPALDRARGADAVLTFDPFVFMAPLTTASDPLVHQVGVMFAAIPGLADVRAPLVLTARSGERQTYELSLPIESLTSLAAVVKPFMGVMGGRP